MNQGTLDETTTVMTEKGACTDFLDGVKGLELNRYCAGACRAPRLKKSLCRAQIPSARIYLGVRTLPFLAGAYRAPSLK